MRTKLAQLVHCYRANPKDAFHDDIPETRIIGEVSDMNKLLNKGSTGRALIMATAIAVTATFAGAPAAQATSATPRVIHEIVVTAQRPVMAVEEMIVTAPRLSRDEVAYDFGIVTAISRATALAAGLETQRAAPREVRLATASAPVERG